MLNKAISFLLLILLFCVGCATNDPTMTPTAVSVLEVDTAVSTTTPTPSRTPQPTSTATQTPTPSVTPIPLPLDPMTPFPTVTPDHIMYETKPIFLSYGGYGGDGGSDTDFVLGRHTPTLVIYGDGQMILNKRDTAHLSPTEMCQLRQQIADTGFLEPHDTLYTEREGSMGGPEVDIQVEDIFYSFYGSDMKFLVEDLAAGYQLIRDFRPQSEFTPYMPQYLILWLEEFEIEDGREVEQWPSDLPSISNLWVNRDRPTILIENDLVDSIYKLFDYTNKQLLFQEDETTYSIIARPILPHETPRSISIIPSYPRDYVPVIDCENDPTLISSAIPTATPTLTSSAQQLAGQGRIVFVSGFYKDQEIYVMEADGTNRLRLTNNRFVDDNPVWSPNGQQIAFVSERDQIQNIFIMNADGTNLKQLTNTTSNNYSPTWSPDGTRIAFISDRDKGWNKSEIYVMDADGSNQIRLTFNDERDLRPVWSPDGHKIAFTKDTTIDDSSFERDYTLTILHLDKELKVEEQLPANNSFQWSPDSSKVITSISLSNSNITAFDLENYETRVIPFLDLTNLINWSIDSNFLVFTARSPSEKENTIHYSEDQSYYAGLDIFALDLTTGEVIQITFMQQDEFSPNLWP